MWLLVVFFLFDPGQNRYCASVRLSSCFFYLLTTIYTPKMKFLATPLLIQLPSLGGGILATAAITGLVCFNTIR